MTMVMDEVVARETRHVLQTYRRQPVTLVRGQGVRVYDADGREYYDLLSGIGVAALGHAHPGLARALAEQAQTLIHTSNLFYHPFQGEVAERLAALSGLPRTFFCNSGTEAVEACLKFARRYWYSKEEPRGEFVGLDESIDGGDHRGTDHRRRGYPAAHTGIRGRHSEGLRGERGVAHCRRNPVRHGPHRAAVLLFRPRAEAASRIDRQGAGRRIPGRRCA